MEILKTVTVVIVVMILVMGAAAFAMKSLGSLND